jgi:peptidoglycan/xylan/chitin deacetylase (PgdA/CDA1 family)
MTISTLARKATKAAVLPAGVLSRRRPGDIAILLYHRVGEGTGEIALPVEAFEEQLTYLAARECVLTIEQALADGAHGGVVVTFDDGYRDFVERVVPLLVTRGIPATLYLATGLVSGESLDAGAEALSWTALRDVVSTGLVTVGSHTHSHADLTRAHEQRIETEMIRSKELIEDRLGVACRHFAYPWAVGSPAADRVARTVFDSAAWDAWKTNRRGHLDPHRLGRTPILRSDGAAFFRAKVRGWLDGEALVYRALRRGPWARS